MQKRCNLLTLLCVIYQSHKENAVYSELISKLFSLRVSEQAGSCPELRSHLQPSGAATGPAPSGTAPAVLQGAVVNSGKNCTESGGGRGPFISHPKFLCLVALNFWQGVVLFTRSSFLLIQSDPQAWAWVQTSWLRFCKLFKLLGVEFSFLFYDLIVPISLGLRTNWNNSCGVLL